jgi:hypothetical protein
MVMKEVDNWEVLRKGNRVRLYTDNAKVIYKDGTVLQGAYASGVTWVIFDGESRGTSVDACDLIKLIK